MEIFKIYNIQGTTAFKTHIMNLGIGTVLFRLMLELKYRLLELELQDIKCI